MKREWRRREGGVKERTRGEEEGCIAGKEEVRRREEGG